MDSYNLLSKISLLAFFVTILLDGFLLTVKTRNKLGNRLLAACFFVNALDISVFFTRDFFSHHYDLGMIRSHLPYLGAPLLYLYMVSVCYTDFKLKPKHLLHTIPFLLVVIVMIPRFHMADTAAQEALLQHFSDTPEGRFRSAVGHLQTISYSIAMFVMLYRYKKRFLENYADAAIYSYKWLLQLTIVTAVAHALGTIKAVFLAAHYENIHLAIQVVLTTLFLGILCWIVLKIMYFPQLFSGIDSHAPLVEDLSPPPTTSPIPAPAQVAQDEQIAAQITRLRQHMQTAEPYLEATITIQQLANEMKMPVRDLSLLINHHIDQHFFDFINEYRIKKAMSILRDPEQRQLNIQEILYMVGFNSKSSFNTAFRKQSDLTPTQYRNNSLSIS